MVQVGDKVDSDKYTVSISTRRPTAHAGMWPILSAYLATESGTGINGHCAHWLVVRSSITCHSIQPQCCRYMWATPRSVREVINEVSDRPYGMRFLVFRAPAGWTSDICGRRVHVWIVH